MQGRGITYFENSRRATLANRAYCIQNPGGFTGYSSTIWGLTACDGPAGYKARGAPPAQNDDGTIAPTAAGGSFPFTPTESMQAMQAMYTMYGSQLWGPYGFSDSFNPGASWYGSEVIGIDQGPIIIMIENYRTGKVWATFRENSIIAAGLAAAGFQPVTEVHELEPSPPQSFTLNQNFPNPFNPATVISYHVPVEADVTIKVFDVLGRPVATLVEARQGPGSHSVTLSAHTLSSGSYFYHLTAVPVTDFGNTVMMTRQMVLMK
ncbi:MAG: T9SS type A sorting domain-containing protein, partial [Proteobacteria bacterium]|nr:T9SS type A sorting domain-containing protein [Pseudomonadota bacterium]